MKNPPPRPHDQRRRPVRIRAAPSAGTDDAGDDDDRILVDRNQLGT
jgi:hypothetical protein